MKKVLLILVLLLFANKGYCDYSFSTTQYTPKSVYYQNYPQSFSSNRKYYSPRAFNSLERKILNHNFMTETPSQRLNRMEEATFGAIQSGNESSRYRALQRALSSNSNSRYYSPNHNTLRNRNLFNFNNFRGMPTGFTPPVGCPSPIFPYDSSYNSQSSMKFTIIDDDY
ncbi:hypothetical protein IJ818_02385 [bacterium]|nr:hypothetical protein [bacterium]